MKPPADTITTAYVATRIRIIRGQAVLFASDLAVIYDVTEDAIVSFVEHLPEVFPDDFVGRRRQGEIVLNEQGASMFAAFFNCAHDVATGIAVMRAFVLLRRRHPPARRAPVAPLRNRRRATNRNRKSKI